MFGIVGLCPTVHSDNMLILKPLKLKSGYKPQAVPALKQLCRAYSSQSGTSPWLWSWHRKQFWRKADNKKLFYVQRSIFIFILEWSRKVTGLGFQIHSKSELRSASVILKMFSILILYCLANIGKSEPRLKLKIRDMYDKISKTQVTCQKQD